jgi:hypothetical protein
VLTAGDGLFGHSKHVCVFGLELWAMADWAWTGNIQTLYSLKSFYFV